MQPWQPLSVITLVQIQTDYINNMITEAYSTMILTYYFIQVIWDFGQIDHIMITLITSTTALSHNWSILHLKNHFFIISCVLAVFYLPLSLNPFSSDKVQSRGRAVWRNARCSEPIVVTQLRNFDFIYKTKKVEKGEQQWQWHKMYFYPLKLYLSMIMNKMPFYKFVCVLTLMFLLFSFFDLWM